MSDDLSIRDIRLEKLARLRELGFDPFAAERFERTDSAQGLLDRFVELGGEKEEVGEKAVVTFAGRLVSLRMMGKASFAHISDGDGKIQGYFKKDELGETVWEAYGLLDIGDHVGVSGYLFTTKTGEKSIHVLALTILSKSLQPLPLGKEKDGQQWYGLEDVEQRYRHRHLDLVCNPSARETLLARSRIVSAVRRYFDSNGFLEVETPMLQLEAGGASARTFNTFYNAYDLDVKLRISLELYLKRIICGDVPKVYEIGRVFRNEGVSNRHNPEFTLLEWYEAFSNLEDVMRTVEELFLAVAESVFGTNVVAQPSSKSSLTFFQQNKPSAVHDLGSLRFERYDSLEIDSSVAGELMNNGQIIFAANSRRDLQAVLESGNSRLTQVEHQGTSIDWIDVEGEATFRHNSESVKLPSGHYQLLESTLIDFAKPWVRVDLLSEIEKHTGLTYDDLSSLERAKKALGDREVKNPVTGKRIHIGEEANLGGLIEKLLEVFVEPTLIEPTFVVGYPLETSPLAKKDPNRPGFTRRFEGYVLGREICNAFSEINDPIDQRERFEHQVSERSRGDDEAHPMDEDFLYALECGMPPTGGCGIGIDRMVMLLTGAEHLREVLMFPMMKPVGPDA